MKPTLLSALATALLPVAVAAAATTGEPAIDHGPFPDDLNGSNFTYPWPVKVFRFTSQQQPLEMAFMDVAPSACAPNGRTALLLHGKNFCGATWEPTVAALAGQGYRVVAADQVGFCKSSKPAGFQFSLSQLALHTRALLDALGVANVTVVGHSLGGMLAVRFALAYPRAVDALVLVAPVGLEDYVRRGVPYISIDASAAAEAAASYASIRAYEQAVYYAGRWAPAYDTWARMLASIYHGPQRAAFLRNQAQVVDAVLTSPVAGSLGDLAPRTLLVVGDRDRTAVGASWAPPEVARRLGRFDVLGPAAARRIPRCTLHRFADLGHAPQVSDPRRFHAVLLPWLAGARRDADA